MGSAAQHVESARGGEEGALLGQSRECWHSAGVVRARGRGVGLRMGPGLREEDGEGFRGERQRRGVGRRVKKGLGLFMGLELPEGNEEDIRFQRGILDSKEVAESGPDIEGDTVEGEVQIDLRSYERGDNAAFGSTRLLGRDRNADKVAEPGSEMKAYLQERGVQAEFRRYEGGDGTAVGSAQVHILSSYGTL